MAISRDIRRDIIREVVREVKKQLRYDTELLKKNDSVIAELMLDEVNLSKHFPQPPGYRKVLVTNRSTGERTFRKRY